MIDEPKFKIIKMAIKEMEDEVSKKGIEGGGTPEEIDLVVSKLKEKLLEKVGVSIEEYENWLLGKSAKLEKIMINEAVKIKKESQEQSAGIQRQAEEIKEKAEEIKQEITSIKETKEGLGKKIAERFKAEKSLQERKQELSDYRASIKETEAQLRRTAYLGNEFDDDDRYNQEVIRKFREGGEKEWEQSLEDSEKELEKYDED